MRAVAGLLILYTLSSPALAEEAPDATGETVYRAHCAECHNGSAMRAPDLAGLRQLSAAAIKAALTGGSMSAQGQGLTPAEIDAVSGFLGSSSVPATNAAGTCTETIPVPADAFAEPHWNGWGVDPEQHRFQPAAMAGLAAEDVPQLKLEWAFGFPGATALRATDGIRRALVYRQRQRQGLFAGCQDRMRRLGLPCRSPGTHVDQHRHRARRVDRLFW